MSIPGAAHSLLDVLEDAHRARYPGGERYTFKIATANELDELEEHVTLFLYRVDVDPTRRHIEIAPEEFGEPGRRSLALNLHFLLTVWGKNDDRGKAHQVLQHCIQCLDEQAILSGAQLTEYDWPPGMSLKVAMESMSTEDMMRIWDSLDVAYRLSVPYVVRTVRTKSRKTGDAAPVVVRDVVSGQKAGSE